MTFDSLVILSSLAAAAIALITFIYSSITSKRGYPNITGIWSISISIGPPSSFDVIKGQLLIKRQFLGELHGEIRTEHSVTDFKGSINRYGMIQGIYTSPGGVSGNLMLLLRPDGSGAEGQYMSASKSGQITQGHLLVERAANK